MTGRRLLLACALLGFAASARAQTISIQEPKCIPEEDNTVIHASLSADAPGRVPRLYFRWKNQTDFYWVAMEAEPGRKFWGIPAKPERRNEEVEYYVALVDAAGQVGSRSESKKTKVTKDCDLKLTPKERGVAENLIVGETTPEQQGEKVVGFLCKGVIARVNSQGIRRTDEICGPCAVVWWQDKRAIIPALAGSLVGVVVIDEPSKSRP
ncbi:MAG TPA: hypothetical protein DD490_02425 [Acidobacteria bacterium]|nr:hypothetical protein [Acidobacteriota bacterium]